MRRALGITLNVASLVLFMGAGLLLVGALAHFIWQSPAEDILGRLHGALDFALLAALARLAKS